MGDAFAELAEKVGRAREEIADGFIKIAVENMANAIKKISVQRGYDVTGYALNCFGGAGGQHACLVADALGMTTVLIHPFSSLLSAYGMGLADIRATRQQAIEQPMGDDALTSLTRIGEALAQGAAHEVAGQGVPQDKIKVFVRAHVRYAGTDTALDVPAFTIAGAAETSAAADAKASATGFPPPLRGRDREGGNNGRRTRNHPSPARGEGAGRARGDLVLNIGSQKETTEALIRKLTSAFEHEHKSRFGFVDRSKALVIEAVSVEAVGGGARFRERTHKTTRAHLPAPVRRARFFSDGRWHRASVFTRDQLKPGQIVPGPAIVIEPHQTIVVEPGWQAAITAHDHLVLTRVKPLKRKRAIGTARRSGHARSVQQPVHVDRRADGRRAAEHRLFGQHQGAARLLLRGVRRRRLARRQRTAHAGASRLDGPRGRDHHPREQGHDRARRRLRHQRAL